MPKDSSQILESALSEVIGSLDKSRVKNLDVAKKIDNVCRCAANKAPIRFLMSAALAKLSEPGVDIRKPYTLETHGTDSYSGRAYDERYIGSFITKYNLPCNSTTAFLTPAFRNINLTIKKGTVLVGRPREIYDYAVEILDAAYKNVITPKGLLEEIIRILLIVKNESDNRINQLLEGLNRNSNEDLPLSSERILTLLEQHLQCRNSSRLPVLMVMAAYCTIEHLIHESPKSLNAHNAADSQTGSLGDIEIVLEGEKEIVTCYEMKTHRVSIGDIDIALTKMTTASNKVDNYIFITTEIIEQDVIDYAKSLYDKTGIEFVVLDCVGFMKYFLHLFHRHRIFFLNKYQDFVLVEPNSSVNQALKEAFLALRKEAETD